MVVSPTERENRTSQRPEETKKGGDVVRSRCSAQADRGVDQPTWG